MILLIEKILHHLGCINPCKYWGKLPINWCRISAINSIGTYELGSDLEPQNLPNHRLVVEHILVGIVCFSRTVKMMLKMKGWKNLHIFPASIFFLPGAPGASCTSVVKSALC